MPAASALDRYIAGKFQAIGLRFHHAENVHDFAVYCRERTLLARAELQRLSAGFTTFYSDQTDEKRGALTRVFGNLRDFGVFMACVRGAVPNVYGPIHLVFRADSFLQMSDIVITKRSIASLGDSWRDRAAKTTQVIDHIASGRRRDGHVSRDWMYAELSCAESRLSFDFLEEVIVEPIVVGGRRLFDVVRAELHAAGINGPRVSERTYVRSDNLDALRDLAGSCERLPDGLTERSPSIEAAKQLPTLADIPADRQRRLALWARYFYFGTIVELRARDEEFDELMAAINAVDTREPCELCESEDDSAAMVAFRPFFIDGFRSRVLEEGTCTRCNGTTLRCLNCGELTPVTSRRGRQDLECSGDCGVKFAVTRLDASTGLGIEIELVGAISPANIAEELAAIVQAKYEDAFIQAALEGEYPVCDVELDQLEIKLGEDLGTATAEWGFGASHHSEDGIYFGGVVTASVTFDAAAVNRDALKESVSIHNVQSDFDFGDDDDG